MAGPGAKRIYRRRVVHLAYAEGRVADVYALRVAFATALARAGVPLARAPNLMRNSEPRLAANVYTRLDLAGARTMVGRVDGPLFPAAIPSSPLAPASGDTRAHVAARRGAHGREGDPRALVRSARPAREFLGWESGGAARN